MSRFRIVKTECNTACSGYGSSRILNEIDLKCILNSIITLNIGGNINKLGNNIDWNNETDSFGYSVSLNEDGSVVAIGAPSFDVITSRDNMNFDSAGGDAKEKRNQWGYTASDGKLVYNQGTDEKGLNNTQASDAFPVGSYFEYTYVAVTTNPYRVRMKVLSNDGNGNLLVEKKLDSDIESDGRNDFQRVDEGGLGHTQVYKWNDTNWVKMGNDITGESNNDWSGFSVSLNGDGSIVAIGAPFYKHTNNEYDIPAGHTRIYQWNNTNWVRMGNDIDGQNRSDDLFGFSVSLSRDGSKVAIGAIGNGYSPGLTQIYKWNSTNWVQMGNDIIGDVSSGSGSSVSLNGDGSMVAIGAVGNEDLNIPRNTRIYEWNDNDWVKMGNDIIGYKGNAVGYSVSLSRDSSIVAIGSIFKSGGILGGPTRIYKWNDTDWVKMGNDIFGATDQDLSGYSVSLSDNGMMLAIGAILNNSNNTHSGNTRIYKWDDTKLVNSWVQILDIKGEITGNWSGHSVSLSGDGSRVAIGAPGKVFDVGADYQKSSGYTQVYRTVNNCNFDILDRL